MQKEIKISRKFSPSPTAKKFSGISFTDAIKAVMEGKKIWRKEWKDKGYYGHRLDETLMLHKPDGKDYEWIITDGDMFGEDWEVL